MYILSGKGSVAGADLARITVEKCQQAGVLWDSDLPEYTLDFATQIPLVSRSIRDGRAADVVAAINAKLRRAEASHDEYMLLCLTAHRLVPQLTTQMTCVNLWDCARHKLAGNSEPTAWLGTTESLPEGDHRFLTLPDHADRMGDLITSVKRGYAALGENYAAHPRHLLGSIVRDFQAMGVRRYFLACTDLHVCQQWLRELDIPPASILDIMEVAADALMARKGPNRNTAFLDAVSDARTHMRYKYLTQSDSPQTDRKNELFANLLEGLPSFSGTPRILDIGGSSTGHSLRVAERLSPARSHITLMDISAASLAAARPIYDAAHNVECHYVECALENYEPEATYDCALCLGVLLYLSPDVAFRAAVRKIGLLLRPGGTLLTRDCLHDQPAKTYMAFGGVIRNREMYDTTFAEAGLVVLQRNEFTIEQSIRRDIVTTIWKKAR